MLYEYTGDFVGHSSFDENMISVDMNQKSKFFEQNCEQKASDQDDISVNPNDQSELNDFKEGFTAKPLISRTPPQSIFNNK